MESTAAPAVSRRPVPRDLAVEACICAVTGVALAVSLAMFVSTPVHTSLSSWADNTLPGIPGAVYMVYALAIVAAIVLGVLCHNVLRFVLYFSCALYLPSILAFSRFDLLGSVIDGGLASLGGGLPPALVLAAGLLLVCTMLAQGAVEEHRALRKSYLERGASREEVDAAVRGNLKYVALAITASAAVAALVSVATTALAYFGESILPPGGYWYLALAVAGGAVIAYVLNVLLRPGRPEKSAPGQAQVPVLTAVSASGDIDMPAEK
jgi:hypothetical protein